MDSACPISRGSLSNQYDITFLWLWVSRLRDHQTDFLIAITWRDLIMEAEVFDRLAELSRVTGFNLDPKKQWYVLKKKFLWNQAECFCKDRNVWSISRWLQYVLSRQQVSSAQTKAVCSAQSKYLYKLANNFRNILHKIISHKISSSVLKKIKLSLNPNYSHISSILQRKNMKKRQDWVMILNKSSIA